MNTYNQAQIDYRERCKNRLKRHLEISKDNGLTMFTAAKQNTFLII